MNAITVETTINAPVSKVWEKWTTPEDIMGWNFASSDRECPAAINELKEGGRLLRTMAAKDGSMSFDFEGSYDAIVPLQSINYTIADGRKVSLVFESIDEETTKLTETFDPEETNPEELQRGGRQAILDNFKDYVENN